MASIKLTSRISFCFLFSLIGACSDMGGAKRKVQQTDCYSNLKAIGVALLQYHQKYGHFPPAYISGKENVPLHSWRVLLLEFLDPDLFASYDFNEPWDSPNNQKLLDKMPRCFRCPNSQPSTDTSYVVIVGKNTAFPGEKTTRKDDIKKAKGKTILVIEVSNSDIKWMEPRDVPYEKVAIGRTNRARISSNDPLGPAVCFADATLSRLGKEVTEKEVKNMAVISENE